MPVIPWIENSSLTLLGRELSSMTMASNPSSPVYFPIRRNVLIAWILSAPPTVLVYRAIMSSAVGVDWAPSGALMAATLARMRRALRMIPSGEAVLQKVATAAKDSACRGNCLSMMGCGLTDGLLPQLGAKLLCELLREVRPIVKGGRRVLEQRNLPAPTLLDRDHRLHCIERWIDVVLAGRHEPGVRSQNADLGCDQFHVTHDRHVARGLMMRENLREMSPNLQLAVHLTAVEADEIAVRGEKKRVIARVALVPTFDKSRVQLAR